MSKFLILCGCFIAFSAFALINLKPVDAEDAVTFTIKNFGFNTNGSLKGIKGAIKWDPTNPDAGYFNISVDANSINTGVGGRDNHLRKPEYFDVATYPTLTFVSTSIHGNIVTGNLTIKGTTKSISFPFTVVQNGATFLFEGNFTINRIDFKVGGGSLVLADDVKVKLKVQAIPQ